VCNESPQPIALDLLWQGSFRSIFQSVSFDSNKQYCQGAQYLQWGAALLSGLFGSLALKGMFHIAFHITDVMLKYALQPYSLSINSHGRKE
jgi:hypothetical protein